MLGKTIAVLALSLLLNFMPPPTQLRAQQGEEVASGSSVNYFGSFRIVHSALETRARDGSRSDIIFALSTRLQLGGAWHFHPDWLIQGRVAGRYSTRQTEFRFLLDDHTPEGGSYPNGTTTADELFVGWRPSSDFQLSLGRFQARFPLAGFIPKGMDRYYGANLGISHTDGLWLQWDMNPVLQLDLVASHNAPEGSTHAARVPLSFDRPQSRLSLLANIRFRDTGGLWVQREMSVSYNPQTFIRGNDRHDYLTLTTRAMMRLPFDPGTGEYWVGGELGLVPIAPSPQSAGFAIDEGRTLFGQSAFAGQVSAYANDLFGRHRLGVLYGHTDPHWLVSASFSPNRTMAEVRYRLTISSSANFEARYRLQTDLFKPDNADFTQQLRDFYARITYRF